jgi:uncharacterized membrane protein YfcA
MSFQKLIIICLTQYSGAILDDKDAHQVANLREGHVALKASAASEKKMGDEGRASSFTSSGHFFEFSMPSLQTLGVTFLLLAAAFIASAAGVGGGGIFMPLLVACCGMTPMQAVPLAQAMIFFGSVINFSFFVSQCHPLSKKGLLRSKIDYDGVVLLEPMLCVGVTLGVLIHRAMPDWFLIFLLCVTLIPAIWRTSKKARSQYAAEAAARQNPSSGPPPSTPGTGLQDIPALLQINLRQVIGIVGIWGLVLGILLISQEIAPGATVCSLFGALQLAGLIGVLCMMTMVMFWLTGRGKPEQTEEQIKEDEKSAVVNWHGAGAYKFPLISAAAGFLGGLLGLGGGVVMSPVLLEIGMHPEAVQATTAMFVLVSSSLASMQYGLHGRYQDPGLVAFYCSIALVGTVLGQFFCDLYVRRHRRFSVITMAITCILVTSFLALLVIGAAGVWYEYSAGNMNAFYFKFDTICGGTGGELVTDAEPFEDWGLRHPHAPRRVYPVPPMR